jgi:hypothetical protein
MTALNKADGGSFDAADERALAELGQSIGVILETWNQANAMRRRLRAATDAASSPSDSA